MNRRTVISAFSLAPFASDAASSDTERRKFIGVWKLVSGVAKHEVTGVIRYPWGKNPVGRLSYDEEGRVFAQLMNPDRRSVGGAADRGAADRGAASAIGAASAEDLREMLTRFNSTFRTLATHQPSNT